MLKRLIKRFLGRFGWEIRRRGPESTSRLFEYRREDGSFDYDRYRRVQIDGNRNKLDKVWACEETIAFLAKYIRGRIAEPTFGICHGSRRGKEQAWFRRHLGCEVIGTEISDTASDFPHTIQWDFHEAKAEWLGAADFIYSNAFDHAYDPEKCLNAWMSCLKPNGICLIEHSSRHERASELDPFGAKIEVMPYLILNWGRGRYFVSDILDAPKKASESLRYDCCLVLQSARA